MTESWKPEDHIPDNVKTALAGTKISNYVIALLNIVQQLKIQKRTGWVDHKVKDPESISDHMYRMGITSMLITNPDINRDKCVRISLVHDLAESLVGDITPNDPMTKEEKHRREYDTIKYLCDKIIAPFNSKAAKEILEDWLAYENVSSPEARYVKDIDKFEMLVQCFEYEQSNNIRLDQFWSAKDAIKTPEVSEWCNDLIKMREEYFSS